jgi:hypothetical protein
MIKGFLSLLNLGALLPQVITGLFGWLNKKEDTRVVENNNSATVSTEWSERHRAHRGCP